MAKKKQLTENQKYDRHITAIGKHETTLSKKYGQDIYQHPDTELNYYLASAHQPRAVYRYEHKGKVIARGEVTPYYYRTVNNKKQRVKKPKK